MSDLTWSTIKHAFRLIVAVCVGISLARHDWIVVAFGTVSMVTGTISVRADAEVKGHR